jgi:dTDP-4-amino-4,6-dideoxygalactose transaminase
LEALRASILRREFDLYGGARGWFDLFQKSEAEAPCGAFAMSEFSRTLLLNCFDYSEIGERRRENYRVLNDALRRFAVFPDLPAGVVPLGFPIRARDRDRLRHALFDRGIYPPIHWPIEGVVPPEFESSHRLAARILTLPCDQRYDGSDMERMARVVLEASGS